LASSRKIPLNERVNSDSLLSEALRPTRFTGCFGMPANGTMMLDPHPTDA
jgi:hypothetical protein